MLLIDFFLCIWLDGHEQCSKQMPSEFLCLPPFSVPIPQLFVTRSERGLDIPRVRRWTARPSSGDPPSPVNSGLVIWAGFGPIQHQNQQQSPLSAAPMATNGVLSLGTFQAEHPATSCTSGGHFRLAFGTFKRPRAGPVLAEGQSPMPSRMGGTCRSSCGEGCGVAGG